MVTTLYIVRHGQSLGNKDRVFQGRLDYELSDLGKTHIRRASEYFEDIHIDKFYSSTLKRAYETSKAILDKNDSLCKQVKKLEGLDEIFAGDIEGKGYEEIANIYPTAHDTLFNSPYDFAPPNGETMVEVYKRCVLCLKQLIRENMGKTFLLVSHGCSIKAMLCYLYGYKEQDMVNVPWVAHGNAVRILLEDEKVINIEPITMQED